MSHRSKNATLSLRRQRHDKKTGKLTESASWTIRDGPWTISTGCSPDETAKVERKLAAHIAERCSATRRERATESIPVADVLSVYYDDKKAEYPNKRRLARVVQVLAHWWGGMMLSDVTSAACQAFIHEREQGALSQGQRNRGGAREYLEVLRAAINHHRKEGLHCGEILVTLPPKPPPRNRWLTRREAAALIRACWRARESRTIHRGLDTGGRRETSKHLLRHIARFILIGLYTGKRASAILAASPIRKTGHAWVDLENGIYYRQEIGRNPSKEKRQAPVRLPRRLLAHMRRWHRKGVIESHFVE